MQHLGTAALLCALASVAPAMAQDGGIPVPAGASAAGAATANAVAPAEALAPQAELMAQAQKLRMVDVAGVQVVKLDPAQAAQMTATAGAGVAQQGATPAPAPAGQPAPEAPAGTGEFLAAFVQDTLNQIPVVQTALQANGVNAADVLRIDIHDNNNVTIYAGSGL